MDLARKIWTKRLPFVLPLTMVVLQTLVPIIMRFFCKASARVLPPFLFEEGIEDFEDGAGETALGGPNYLASVTLLAESIKGLVALAFMAMTAWQRPGATVLKVATETPARFAWAASKEAVLILPAMLYFISKVLVRLAASRMRSAHYLVIMNSRIILAAIFSAVLLPRHINGEQWRAIVVVVCAAMWLCLENVYVDDVLDIKQEPVGMILALGTAFVSATAGVLVDGYLNIGTHGADHAASSVARPLKANSTGDNNSEVTIDFREYQSRPQNSVLWERQAVLAFFNTAFAMLYTLLFHADALQAGRLFRGWNETTVLLTLLLAAQGLVVVMTIQCCGIVFRLMLGSIAICFCASLECLFSRNDITVQQLLGTMVLIIGANFYCLAGLSSQSSSSSFIFQRVLQHDDGPGGVYLKDKCKNRSRKEDSSLRAAFSTNFTAADNNTRMKQVAALLLLPLLYLPVSSYISVMLRGQEENNTVGHRESEALSNMLQTASLSKLVAIAPESDGEPAEEEDLRQSYFASFIRYLSTSDDGLPKYAAVMLAQKERHIECSVQEAKDADPWNRNDGIRRDIGVCMQIKNDADIIDEYIVFHWVQGVSEFIIYDDGSEDDPWSVVEKYAALGIVEYHDMTDHPDRGSATLELDNLNMCFTSMQERASDDGLRWVMFSHLDEFFLSSVPGKTLSETHNVRYKGEACLEVAQTRYGSFFQYRKPSGLVTETYLLPDYASQDYYKLASRGKVQKGVTIQFRPQCCGQG
jgi:hypothetical protein